MKNVPGKMKAPKVYFTIKIGSGKRPNMGGFRSRREVHKSAPVTIYRGIAAQLKLEAE